MESFERSLTKLINQYSIDAEYNIPDFLIARFLVSSMGNLAYLVDKRDKWFAFTPTFGGDGE